MSNSLTSAHNPATRWWILAFISLLMFGNYYVYDMVAPVAEQLERELGFSNTQIGTLNAIYSLPNMFLMLFAGIIIDRVGARTVTLVAVALCLVGTALSAAYGEFVTMAAGRLLFGIGAETMLVAVTVGIAVWFARGGVAFAMALSLSVARAGSYAADLSPVWASGFYEKTWQEPFWLATGFAVTSLVFALMYWWLDRRGTPPPPVAGAEPVAAERFQWSQVLKFDRSFWYLLGLSVLFYSVIVPFRSTFSIKYFQHGHQLDLADAATISSFVYLVAIFVTPLFGWIVDRWGRRAFFMVLGSLLLPLSFLGLVTGGKGLWFTTILLGISYSLIPAILWPAVVKLVKESRLGTAYGLLFMIQNAGLTLCNIVAGGLNDAFEAGAANPAGYVPMIVFFAVLATGALAFSIALWRRETGPHGHGLELPGALKPQSPTAVVH
jgi:MFS family permease